MMLWLKLLTFFEVLSLSVCLNLTTATVSDIHAAILANVVTCRDVIQGYLDRVVAYDRNGPNLQSIITVNPRALMDAIALDNRYKASKKLVGVIHCAPMVIKDNIDVAGLPTTAGLNAFRVRAKKYF